MVTTVSRFDFGTRAVGEKKRSSVLMSFKGQTLFQLHHAYLGSVPVNASIMLELVVDEH